ncbi:MAG: phage head closure protein [Lachnospiraceae bacterium]|nr:phage head closure protein [Lachnospiraceae bacterium]
MINNGRLRNRVDIYGQKTITTPLGSDKEVYGKLKTVYAEIRPLRGKEYLESVQLEHSVSYKITIRYTDVNETNYIKYDGRFFDIESVIDVENRHRDIEIMCNEHKGNDIELEET